jgi:hypothetical protein
MKNWFDIIPPHKDIRKGHFDEAVFAADLDDVAAGIASPDYGVPRRMKANDWSSCGCSWRTKHGLESHHCRR